MGQRVDMLPKISGQAGKAGDRGGDAGADLVRLGG
jgi:hypothetical protein